MQHIQRIQPNTTKYSSTKYTDTKIQGNTKYTKISNLQQIQYKNNIQKYNNNEMKQEYKITTRIKKKEEYKIPKIHQKAKIQITKIIQENTTKYQKYKKYKY